MQIRWWTAPVHARVHGYFSLGYTLCVTRKYVHIHVLLSEWEQARLLIYAAGKFLALYPGVWEEGKETPGNYCLQMRENYGKFADTLVIRKISFLELLFCTVNIALLKLFVS